MLKIYDVVSYVSIDGAEWRAVGHPGYCCIDEDRDVKIILDDVSFSEACEYIDDHSLDGIYPGTTLWRNKPVICVYYCGVIDDVRYKNFNTISYKKVYTENKNVTLGWLMEHLSAEQTIQYLKERGITTCQMNF